jgi:hypothetical protein
MNTHPIGTRPTRAITLAALAATGLMLALLAGCQDSKSSGGSNSNASGTSQPAGSSSSSSGGSGSQPSGR